MLTLARKWLSAKVNYLADFHYPLSFQLLMIKFCLIPYIWLGTWITAEWHYYFDNNTWASRPERDIRRKWPPCEWSQQKRNEASQIPRFFLNPELIKAQLRDSLSYLTLQQLTVTWYLRCWMTGNMLGVWKVLTVAGPSPPVVMTCTSSL